MNTFLFQSTHPHGVRHVLSALQYSKYMFQSTHPHGVRLTGEDGYGIGVVFQSTHPHGVRRLFVSLAFIYLKFQSTHPHGVRLEIGCILSPFGSFNPRTHMGCDGDESLCDNLSKGFNPRTHMGCDLLPLVDSNHR